MTTTLTDDFYEVVDTAIRTQLLTATGFPIGTVFVDENEDFKPEVKVPWVRYTTTPQPNGRADINNDVPMIRHRGAVLIDCYALPNDGPSTAKRMAGGILRVLPPGKTLSNSGVVVIVRQCFMNQGRSNSGYYLRPITLSWTADTFSTP